MPALFGFDAPVRRGWIAAVDVRAKMLVCSLASVVSIAVSNFWGQALLVAASLLYALCLRRPLLLCMVYCATALMVALALGCFWGMTYFVPALAEKFAFSSLLVPFMRLLVMINVVLPLAFSSRLQAMLNALQSLRLPFCTYLPTVVVFRFLPEFGNDIRQVAESLRLRGYRVTAWTLTRHPLLSLRLLLTPLLFRALRSSEDLGIAAELKGLGGGCRMTPYRRPGWTRTDSILAGGALLVALAALACQLRWGGGGFMA